MIKFKKNVPNPSFIEPSQEDNTKPTKNEFDTLLNEINKNNFNSKKKYFLKFLTNPALLIQQSLSFGFLSILIINIFNKGPEVFNIYNPAHLVPAILMKIALLSIFLSIPSIFYYSKNFDFLKKNKIKIPDNKYNLENINVLKKYLNTSFILKSNYKSFWLEQIKWFVNNTNEKLFMINNESIQLENLYTYIDTHYDNENTKFFLLSLLNNSDSHFLSHINSFFISNEYQSDTNKLSSRLSLTSLLFQPHNNLIQIIKNIFNKDTSNKTSFTVSDFSFHFNKLFNLKNILISSKNDPELNNSHIIKSLKYMKYSTIISSFIIFLSFVTPYINNIDLTLSFTLGVIFPFLLTLINFSLPFLQREVNLFHYNNSYKNILMKFTINNDVFSFIKNNEALFYNTFNFLVLHHSKKHTIFTITKANEILNSWKENGLTQSLTQDIFTFVMQRELRHFFYTHITSNCNTQDDFDKWTLEFQQQIK